MHQNKCYFPKQQTSEGKIFSSLLTTQTVNCRSLLILQSFEPYSTVYIRGFWPYYHGCFLTDPTAVVVTANVFVQLITPFAASVLSRLSSNLDST